jgi:hypothetical protein
MMDKYNREACVAALWILHGAACAKLLRAHGRTHHAESFDAALKDVAEIVAEQVGPGTLSAAIAWATREFTGLGELPPDLPDVKHTLQ